MKKKILSFVLAICLLVPCVFMLTACKGDDVNKTMNVSINPEVSFVVDSKNKVVSVMYENDDASTVYANVNFVGLKADAAVELMIENAVITGHFDFNGEDISLSVNGNTEADITKLENLVKEQINEVCASLGVEVTVNVEELTEAARKQALVVKAKVLAPEKSDSELNEMSTKELINLIKEKQNQFKGLVYGQIEEIKQQFSAVENQILQTVKNLRDRIADYEETITENEALLNNENVPELVKETYREVIKQAKANIKEVVKQIDTKLATYEQDKQAAINAAKDSYAALKTQLVNQYNTMVETAKTGLNNHLDAKLAAGTITQEQYDYWKNLTNK